MKYSLDWLLEKIKNEEKLKYLYFWGHQQAKNGTVTSSCLSQWFLSPFTVDGETYLTAEHWMMAKKALLFSDKQAFDKILLSKSPAEAKKIGREVRNYDEKTWEQERLQIVVKGNVNKFSQNQNLKDYLLQTGDRVLVEASPVDIIWGIGLSADSEKAKNPEQWNGLNLLGFALMEVRDILMCTE